MTRLHRILPALIGSLLLVLASPVYAGAEDVDMVGLGDSYAAGVGSRSYDPDSGACQRSSYGYAAQDAARIGANLTFVACSGATTANVMADQIDSVEAGTDVVTLTVGGNDIGFVPVLTECAQPFWSSNCNGAIDTAEAKIRDELPGALDTVYSEISSRAPDATVVVTGYPHLFMGEDCNAATFFSPAEEERLNATADLLNATIRAEAEEHGFTFVDPTDAFIGHAVCDDDAWINGFSNPVSDSYHPNAAGHTAYADLVEGYLA